MIYIVSTIRSKIKIPSSGTSTHYITYKGNYPGHAGVLNFDGNPMLDTNSKDYIIIDGLTLQNGTIGISANNSDHIIIKNCTIHTMSLKGIISKNSSNVTIGGTRGNGNDIYNCGVDTGGQDISLSNNSNTTISYNKLYATETSYGIDGVAVHWSNDVLIEYNTIHSHNHSSGQHGEDGVDIKNDNNGVIVRFNHIYDHRYQTGITVQMGSHNVQIYGNDVHNNKWGGVYIKRGCEGSDNMHNIDIWANLIYKNGAGVIISNSGGSSCGGPANIYDVGIYNNVLAENGNWEGNSVSRAGVAILFGSGHIVKNNIFYKNHGKYGGNTYEQVYLNDDSSVTFNYNYYYYPGVSERDIFYVAGSEKRLAEFKSLGQEAHGAERDPKFTDADNNNYTLASDSPCIDSGTNLNITFAEAIDPNRTNFNAFPPLVGIADQRDYGSWEKGAYIYGQSDGNSLSPPLGLKIQ